MTIKIFILSVTSFFLYSCNSDYRNGKKNIIRELPIQHISKLEQINTMILRNIKLLEDSCCQNRGSALSGNACSDPDSIRKNYFYPANTPSFTCGNPFTDIRDGKTYNTVLIGSQCWMTQNLDYSTSGALTPIATGQGAAGTQKYCYGDNAANCTTYGGLYEWAEMMNGSASCNGTGAPPNDKCATNVQGICPAGWHVPSHYEWTTLEKNVGTNPGAFPYDITTTGGWLGTDEGGNLKETGTTHWTTPNTGATNSSNFTALPGGYSWSGSFYFVGNGGYWWSAAECGGADAWGRGLGFSYAAVGRYNGSKLDGYSVRCVKD